MRPEGLCQLKNSNDTIGNRTRNLPTCSAMPQPTALLCYRQSSYTHFPLTRRAQLGFSFARVVYWHCQLLRSYTAYFAVTVQREIVKNIILKYRKKIQTFLEISREICPVIGSTGITSVTSKLPRCFLTCKSFTLVGTSQDTKNYFRDSSVEERLRNAGIELVGNEWINTEHWWNDSHREEPM